MKYLFIGGPADGRRIELDEAQPYHKVMKLKPFSMALVSNDEPVFEEHTYNLSRASDKDGDHLFYQHSSLVEKGCFGLLLESYPEPPKENPFKDDPFIEIRLVVRTDNQFVVSSRIPKHDYPGTALVSGSLAEKSEIIRTTTLALSAKMLQLLEEKSE